MHGNIWALESVLADISSRGADHILNLGDSLYGPLKPAETADLVMNSSIISISGNQDRILVGEDDEVSPSLDFVKSKLKPVHLNWLKKLEATKIFMDDFFLCHGTTDNDDEYLIHKVDENGVSMRGKDELSRIVSSIDQKFILCGHDHVSNAIRLDNGKVIINPGSVGLQAYNDDTPFPHTMESGSPTAKYVIVTTGADGKYGIEKIEVKYNYEAAAECAGQNGRQDWIEWLRTGRADL